MRLRHGEYTLLYAQPLLEELVDAKSRPRIREKYHLTDLDIQTVAGLILLHGPRGVTATERIGDCRDPKADKFLRWLWPGRLASSSVETRSYPYGDIPIVGPSALLRMLDQEER